jgi:hypothetical protein
MTEKIEIDAKIISREIKRQLQTFQNQKENALISKGKNAIHKYITNKLKPNDPVPCLIDDEGKMHSKDEQKCSLLAKYFQNTFMGNPYEQIASKDAKNQKLSDFDFNIGIIWNILRSLPGKNSTSPDDIPYIVLKKCADQLAPIIADIFRFILDSGQIPSVWQKSIIIPIFKKGEKTNPKNYRPISLTCTLCRIFERILSEKITNYLNNKSFFQP